MRGISMITVRIYETEEENIIKLEGHAEYAPKGEDIVCAAVTGMVILTDEICSELNGISIIAEGKAKFKFIKSYESERFIYNFSNAIEKIADEYGDYIQLIEGAEYEQ